MSQLTLNFEPTLPDRFPTLRALVQFRASVVAKSMKAQAADLDMAPSTLTRKLNPAEGDTQRFNLDDLEAWLVSTGDAPAVIEYLAAKYMDTDEARRVRAIARVEVLAGELERTLGALRAAA